MTFFCWSIYDLRAYTFSNRQINIQRGGFLYGLNLPGYDMWLWISSIFTTKQSFWTIYCLWDGIEEKISVLTGNEKEDKLITRIIYCTDKTSIKLASTSLSFVEDHQRFVVTSLNVFTAKDIVSLSDINFDKLGLEISFRFDLLISLALFLTSQLHLVSIGCFY